MTFLAVLVDVSRPGPRAHAIAGGARPGPLTLPKSPSLRVGPSRYPLPSTLACWSVRRTAPPVSLPRPPFPHRLMERFDRGFSRTHASRFAPPLWSGMHSGLPEQVRLAWLDREHCCSRRRNAGSPALRVSPHAVGARPPKRFPQPKLWKTRFVGECPSWPTGTLMIQRPALCFFAFCSRALDDESSAASHQQKKRRGRGHQSHAGCAAGVRGRVAVIESRAHSRR